jgi:hypothetical protein
MIIAVAFILGFFWENSSFGSNLISAFEFAKYALYFEITVFAFLIASLGLDLFDEPLKKVPAFVIFNFVIILPLILQLWLVFYIVESIPPGITMYSELSSNVQYGIVAFSIIWLIRILRLK